MKKILVLSIFILLFGLTGCSKGNAISGKYNCSFVDGSDQKTVLILDLKGNNTFNYQVGNDSITGTYTFKKEKKTFENMKYYLGTLKAQEMTFDGKTEEFNGELEFEFGLEKKGKKKEGVIIFIASNRMYYCKNY